MNRIVKIFATGFLSVWTLTASAQNGEGDTKESLFNPVNYAVISQTIAPDARGGGLGDVTTEIKLDLIFTISPFFCI